MTTPFTGLLTRPLGLAVVLVVALATALFGLQPSGDGAALTGAVDAVVDPVASQLLDGLPDDGLNRVIVRFDDPSLVVDGLTSAGEATGLHSDQSPGDADRQDPAQRSTRRRNGDLTPGLGDESLAPSDVGDARYAEDEDLGEADQALLDALNGVSTDVGDGDGVAAEIDSGVGAPVVPSPTASPTPAPTTTTSPSDAPSSDDETGLIVEITDPDDLASLPGVVEVRPVGPGYAAVITELTDAELTALPGIAEVEPDALRVLFADDYHHQWALRNTSVPGADIRWEEARQHEDGNGVVVAVIDSGVDTSHRDLASQMWFNTDEDCGNGVDDDANGYVDDCNGWDFANHDATVNDAHADNSHGTHVSGIIAGDDDGDGISGAAAGAQIMSLKIFHNGGANSSRLTAAINYAVDNGADVINMSLGGGSPTYAEQAALQRADDAGIAVIAAAGNDAKDNDRYPTYPASYSYPVLVSVASSNISDQHSSRFSNYGRTSVDLHAPGEQIYSALPGGRTGNMTGTSMATPYVSAVAALVVAQGRRGADVRQHLMDTAQPLAQLAGRTVTGGRLDAAAAVGGGRARSDEPDFLFGSFHDAQEPDTDSALVNVGASLAEMGTDAIEVRATLGMAYGSDLYAVMGHSFNADGREVTTDDEGRFMLTSSAIGMDRDIELRDGIDLVLDWELPSGDYALMVQAVEQGAGVAGAGLAEPKVVFFRVAPEPAPAPEPVPGDGGDGGQGGGDSPPPGGGGDSGGPGVVLGPGPDDGADGDSGGGGGGGGDGGSTTSPPPSGGGGGGGTTSPPPSGGGTTTPPPSGGGGSGGGGSGGGGNSGGPGVVVSPGPGGGGGGGGSTTTPPPSDDGGTTSPPPSGGVGGGGTTSPPPSTDDGDDGSGEVQTTGYVNPPSGRPGQASVTVQIDTGIPDGAFIHFDSSNATILSRLGPTRVTVRPPAHTTGTVDVVVVHNGERTVLPDAYTYLPDDTTSTPPPSGGGGTTTPAPGDGGSGGGGSGDGGSGDGGTDGGDPGSGGGGADGTPPGGNDATGPTQPTEPFEHNGLMLGPFPATSPMDRIDSSRVSTQRCAQETCGPRDP